MPTYYSEDRTVYRHWPAGRPLRPPPAAPAGGKARPGPALAGRIPYFMTVTITPVSAP